jgi:hypothetical protein
MKKADFKFDDIQVNGGEKEVRMVPLAVGDELNFTLSKEMFVPRDETINGTKQQWTDVQTDGDIAVSASQLTRRNNGLTLNGKTVKERLASFVDLFSEEGTLKLKVTKVVERDFTQEDGSKSTSRYLKFEVV